MYPYSYYSVSHCHTFLPLLLPSSLIPSLTCLTHSFTHSPAWVTLCVTHSLSLTFLLFCLCIILSHSLHCLTHSLTHSPVSLTLLHSLPHLLLCITHSRGSLIYSLSHSLTNFPTSIIPLSLLLIPSFTHYFTHSSASHTQWFTPLSHSLPCLTHALTFTPVQYSALLFPPHHRISEWFEATIAWHIGNCWATQIRLSPWCNLDVIVLLKFHEISWYDGHMMALRGLHVAVLPSWDNQSPSCFPRIVFTMWKKSITRSKNKDHTILQDALTMALWRAKWIHELNTKMNLRKVIWKFFGMPKILPPHTKFLPDPEKRHTWSNDGLRCPHGWPDVFTIRADYEHFLFRVSIWCQLRDSVTPAL